MKRLLLITPILLLTACTHTAPPSAASSANHAQCLVCKYNADLACIDITVDDKTPRTTYLGQTYYFCSEECRTQFQQTPAKYLAH